MAPLLKEFCFCLVLTYSLAVSLYNPENQCKSVNSYSSGDSISLEKERMLDSCILYNLTKRYVARVGTGEEYSYTQPLTSLSQDRPSSVLEMKVLSVTLDRFRFDERRESAGVSGRILMEWQDDRLSWKSFFPQRSHITIFNYYDKRRIWTPKFGSSPVSTLHLGRGEYRQMSTSDIVENDLYGEVPTIDSSGKVTAKISFHINDNGYVFDYTDFPFDKQLYCAEHVYDLNDADRGSVSFVAKDVKIDLNKQFTRRYGSHAEKHYWLFDKLDVKVDSDDKTKLLLCLYAERDAPAAKIETVLPMAVSGLIAMLAPLFGTFANQAMVKMVALFFQYYCMQSFVVQMTGKHMGNNLPKILKFQEFLMVFTLVTLIFTVILWVMYRRSSSRDPPMWLVRFSDRVNDTLGCADFMDVETEKLVCEENTVEIQKPVGNNGWRNIAHALSIMSFVIGLVVYGLGLLAVVF